jgi:hypothetical protein
MRQEIFSNIIQSPFFIQNYNILITYFVPLVENKKSPYKAKIPEKSTAMKSNHSLYYFHHPKAPIRNYAIMSVY